MRTSKVSQDTTRIFNTISPNTLPSRTTRSAAKTIASFALGYDATAKEDQTPSESDIEDLGQPSLKRKRSPTTPLKIKTEHTTTWTSPRKVKQKADISPRTPAKFPAKRATSPGGTSRYTPPSNWEQIYTTVEAYRNANPIAPVDTMGCEDLFWQAAPPAQQRYHTLTALMLSSQTKDTVTAVAMQRLHAELVPQAAADSKLLDSSLTVGNILAADPVHLDSLIGKVGFHNTKTKNIQRVAKILREQYSDDIPNTVEGLMALPGVGPKMAYLAMSAAWKEDIGIGVDVHVHRITNLWGWHVTKTPEQTREWLEGWLPQERWHHINKMLVGLGQTVCLPIGRRCGECPLAGKSLCKSEVRGWVKKEESKKRVKVKKQEEVEVEIETEDAVIKNEDVEVRESMVTIKEEVV